MEFIQCTDLSLTIASTYNHYFTDTIQKIRQRKHQKLTRSAQKDAGITIRDDQGNYRATIDSTKLEEAMNNSIERNMDTFSSAEALDTTRAYYKDELKYFVNAVAKAIIERHLVEPLPEIILSPVTVTQMSEAEIEFVAAEPPEITQQREYLENKRCMLEKGLETFREAMGGLKR